MLNQAGAAVCGLEELKLQKKQQLQARRSRQLVENRQSRCRSLVSLWLSNTQLQSPGHLAQLYWGSCPWVSVRFLPTNFLNCLGENTVPCNKMTLNLYTTEQKKINVLTNPCIFNLCV